MRLREITSMKGLAASGSVLAVAGLLLAACGQGVPSAARVAHPAHAQQPVSRVGRPVASPAVTPVAAHAVDPASRSMAVSASTPGVSSAHGSASSSAGTPASQTNSDGAGASSGGGVAPPVTTPPAPPVTTPPTTTPAQSSYIVPGENGIFEALNAARTANGLTPLQGWANSAPGLGLYPQNCALGWNGNHCASNEVETGVLQLSGQQAVNLWMGDSAHRSIIMEPGAEKAYIGWAWLAGASGGYVAVVDICGNTPGWQANCP